MDAEDLAAQFVLKHISWQRSNKKQSAMIKHVSALSDPAVFNAAAHFLGYILGDKLYYGLTDGIIPKKLIRDLFKAPLDKEREASETYMEFVEKVRGVKIPQRI